MMQTQVASATQAVDASMSAPLCQAPDPVLRRPRFTLPAGATDCHAHICGPAHLYPYAAQRIYTPPDALLHDYRALLNTLGVERAVIVQPSVYGDDNRALLAALATDLVNLRGIAVVRPSISDNALGVWAAERFPIRLNAGRASR